MGKPDGRVIQQYYTVYSNGTLTARDNASDWYTIDPLGGLPSGASQTSLVANTTNAYERYVISANGNVLTTVTIAFSVRQQFCQPAGLEIAISGKVDWGSTVSRTIALHFASVPTVVQGTRILFGNQSTGIFLGFDWNDSMQFAPTFNSQTNTLSYTVTAATFSIDPVTIGTCTGSANAIVYNNEPKVAQANGRWWVFYDDGSHTGYVSSADGSTWTSETTIASTYYTANIAVYAVGDTIYYVRTCSSGVCYRYGTANSDGSITWSISESSFTSTYGSPQVPTLMVDGSGNIWVAVQTYNSVTGHSELEVWKHTSSWSNVLTTITNGPSSADLLTSSSGQAVVYQNYTAYHIDVRYTTNGGSSWSSPAIFDLSGANIPYSDAVLLGDTVEMAVEASDSPSYSYYIYYEAYTFGGSWASAVGIGPGYGAAISTDGNSGLSIVYTYSSTTVEVVSSGNSGQSWSTPQTVSSSESGIGGADGPSSDPFLSSGNMAFVWEEGSSYPYDVRFAALPVIVTQPITATLPTQGATQTIDVSGCNAGPTSFSGDGGVQDIVASPSCALTLTTPEGYIWANTGPSTTVTTCSSGTCSSADLSYVEMSSNGNAFVGQPSDECALQDNPTIVITFNATMDTNDTNGNQWSAQVNSYPVYSATENPNNIGWSQFNMAIAGNGGIYGAVELWQEAGGGTINSVFDNSTSTIHTVTSVQSGDQFIITIFQNDSIHLGAWAVDFYFYQKSTGNSYSQELADIPARYYAPVCTWQLNIVGENSGEHVIFSTGGASVTYYSFVDSTVCRVFNRPAMWRLNTD